MNDQDLITTFREQCRQLARSHKYAQYLKAEDEERTCQAFRMALENPKISDKLLFELLTGERA